MTNELNHTVRLGEGDSGHSLYIAFAPPLTIRQLDDLPLPEKSESLNFRRRGFDCTELEFSSETFSDEQADFIKYAQRLASHLGSYVLDTEIVKDVGPGSSIMIQANGQAKSASQ